MPGYPHPLVADPDPATGEPDRLAGGGRDDDTWDEDDGVGVAERPEMAEVMAMVQAWAAMEPMVERSELVAAREMQVRPSTGGCRDGRDPQHAQGEEQPDEYPSHGAIPPGKAG